MDEAEALELFDRCSNVGRWGADDQRGTANHITEAMIREATRLVTLGRSVSLAHPLTTEPTPDDPTPMVHRMTLAEGGCIDTTEISPHGFGTTHLDALGHVYFDGRMWNGRRARDHVSEQGMTSASISAFGDGLVARGVLLDVAAARGVRWLEPGDEITPDDLERAETRAGVRVGAGDAMIVRTGTEARRASLGWADPTVRAGLGPSCIPWIFDRNVAIYSGDCVERLPSGFPLLPTPLHQIGMVAMGLILLDNTAVEGLAATCNEIGRWQFLLVCAPLRIVGGTGSAINPLALF